MKIHLFIRHVRKISGHLLSSSVLIFLYNCDPIASNMEITNPKEIRPDILVHSAMNNDTGQSKELIEVIIRDINNDPILIEGGNVYVNGIKMRPPQNDLFGAKDNSYELISDINADSLYIFEIVFSDSTVYLAWVESPEIDLLQLDLPESYPRNTNLTIEWLDVDFRYPQYCAVQYYDINDGFTQNKQVNLKIRSPYGGEYTIKGKYIKYQDVSDLRDAELRIKVIAETSGEVSEEFLSGSSIKCQMSIYQDIEVY